MSNAVKVGQVWRDKDKRRNTVIEIIDVFAESGEVTGLVVGTEEERSYNVERLVKRWELVEEKGDPDEVEADLKPAPEINLDEFVTMNDGKPSKPTGQKISIKVKQPTEHNATKRVVGGRNYHLLVECPVDGEDGQRFRTTQKQFDSFGAPLCGCHHKAMNLIEQH